MSTKTAITADEAIARLKEGNKKYIEQEHNTGSISKALRSEVCEGQSPYAIIIGCSDSRVVPEYIFQAAIGELFVIRVAGNVIDKHQLGSVEYAADHLDCRLVVVLGHDRCGAVDAALHHEPDGYIRYITDAIRLAVGNETDEEKACCLNVKNSVRIIEENLDIRKIEHERGMKVVGAIYHLQSGEVEFI